MHSYACSDIQTLKHCCSRDKAGSTATSGALREATAHGALLILSRVLLTFEQRVLGPIASPCRIFLTTCEGTKPCTASNW